MAQDVVVSIARIDTRQLVADVRQIEAAYLKGEAASKKAATEGVKDQQRLDTSVRKTVADTQRLGTTATTSGKQFTTATRQMNSNINQTSASLKNLASSIGIALGVQQVIQFGKASVEAYVDAEKNAQLLLFALKGNAEIQKELLNQATQLQNTTIYDDDTVIRAQTFLANQQRAPSVIQKVIDAAKELATVQGVDLETATRTLDATLEGNIGRLGKLDGAFKQLTPTQLQNGAALDLIIKKYGGLAEATGDTAFGRIQKLKNEYNEFQEMIGEYLLPTLTKLIDTINAIDDGDPVAFVRKYGEAWLEFAQKLTPLGLAYTNIFKGVRMLGQEVGVWGDKTADTFNTVAYAERRIANITDQELDAAFEELSKTMNFSREEFNKFVADTRASQLDQIFSRIKTEIQLTNEQLLSLVDMAGKYGIQQNLAAENVLRVRNATDEQLKTLYKQLSEQYGVTKEAFDQYVSTVKNAQGVGMNNVEITKEQIGAYEQLTKDVGLLNAQLLNQITLGQATAGTLEKIREKQAELEAINKKAKFRVLPDEKELMASEAIIGDFLTASGAMQDERYQEQLQRANDFLTEIGVIQEETVGQQMQKLDELYAAGLVTQKQYIDAVTTLQIDSFIKSAEAIGTAFSQVGNALSTLFGSIAGDSAALAEFNKAIAIIEITIQGGIAIAKGIAQLTDPFTAIFGIAQIIGGITSIIGGLISQVESAQVPAPPKFAEGTARVTGGIKGKDSVPAILMPDEAVIKANENMSYPGMAAAWNAGNLDRYIMKQFVAPALEEQRKELENKRGADMAERMAESMTLNFGGKFDDYRIHRDLVNGNAITARGFGDLASALKNKTTKRGGYD